MASFMRPPRRGRHVELPTHQRRARHLRNISARNLVFKGMQGLLSLYFTLHDPRHSAVEIYRSETIHATLNPSWKSFTLLDRDDVQPSFSSVMVRVWFSNDDLPPRGGLPGGDVTVANGFEDMKPFYNLAMEWTVDLMALVYAGEHMFSDLMPGDTKNLLVFGMFEGYYVAPAEEKLSEKVLAASLNVPRLDVDKESVRHTYSYSALTQLNAIHRRLATKQQTIRTTVDTIKRRKQDCAERRELARQCEVKRTISTILAEELDRQEQCLSAEEQVLADRRQRLEERKTELSDRFQELERSEQDLQDLRRHLQTRRDLSYRTGTSLQARRCIMLRELSFVFPIVEQARNGFSILGIPVPHSESLSSQTDEAIAVGFGYAAHLVVLLALILHLPLRYPIVPKGSRSVMVDNISNVPLLVKGECHLFPKQRADKDPVFKYALYLLNKNISQLRYYCDLGTPDGRMTLKNIKSLLDRFAVIGDRLMSQAVRPMPLTIADDGEEDTIDGLPLPTRTFSILPTFRGGDASSPNALSAITLALAGSEASPQLVADASGGGNVNTTLPRPKPLGHRRQHSAPLSPSSVLISADDCSNAMSANCSPSLTPRAASTKRNSSASTDSDPSAVNTS